VPNDNVPNDNVPNDNVPNDNVPNDNLPTNAAMSKRAGAAHKMAYGSGKIL
jgi:hypothetical protein